VPVGQPFTVRWTAADADGDELRAAVQVSPDGERWIPVASGLTGGELQLTATPAMAGDAVRVRVTTSDGWRSAQADSAPFGVSGGLTDGKLVVSARRDGVWVAENDGSGFAKLDVPLATGQGRWSPDGTRIAYAGRFQDSDGAYRDAAHTMKPDATDRRRVARGNTTHPRWVGPARVAWLDLSGFAWRYGTVADDETRVDTPWPVEHDRPCDLTADGTQLVVRRGHAMVVAKPDGTDAVPVPGPTPVNTAQLCPTISPDGRKVAVLDNGDIAVWDVARACAPSSPRAAAGTRPHLPRARSVGPTGEWIYYTPASRARRNGSLEERPDGTDKELV
jgi:hypothetical protein